jgi:transcription antitermination factor NusG
MLDAKGYRQYLPLYRKISRWSDRIKTADVPLFAGYVFASFDPDRRLPILTIPGVIQIVGNDKPQAIPEEELRSIQQAVASGLHVEPWPIPKVGDVVRISAGALSGLEGVLIEVRSRHRLVVSLSLLNRAIAVQIDRSWIA